MWGYPHTLVHRVIICGILTLLPRKADTWFRKTIYRINVFIGLCLSLISVLPSISYFVPETIEERLYKHHILHIVD